MLALLCSTYYRRKLVDIERRYLSSEDKYNMMHHKLMQLYRGSPSFLDTPATEQGMNERHQAFLATEAARKVARMREGKER